MRTPKEEIKLPLAEKSGLNFGLYQKRVHFLNFSDYLDFVARQMTADFSKEFSSTFKKLPIEH